MKAIRFFMLAWALFASLQVYAQKVKLAEGKLDVLKGVTKLNVIYDYNRMVVGKFQNEADYVKYKKDQYNKIEPGRGDRWAKLWVSDRKDLFVPKFEEMFTKYSHIGLSEGHDQKYTVILRTVFSEPGYNVGVWKKDAEIDAIALIVESTNPAIVIAKISLDDCKGGVYNDNEYNPDKRLQEAYVLAGKALGKFLKGVN